MTDSMTATQKREAIKIAKRKVALVQERLIAEFRIKALAGDKAPANVQKAYKAYKRAKDKATEASSAADELRVVWYGEMGMTKTKIGSYAYAAERGNRVKDGVVYLVPSDARQIDNAILRAYNRKTKPSVDEVIESLKDVSSAQTLINQLEGLQEFIEIELPTDMWLTTSEAYNALADMDARITGIING